MAYCTKQDLLDRFGERELIQLTDRTNTPVSTIDDTVVDRAIEDATSLVDGYVSKAYKLPLATPPQSLTAISADIARYKLHARGVEKDSPVQRAYDQALAFLRDISRGLVQLVETDTGATPAEPDGGGVQVVAPERVFTRESLRKY